MAEHAFSIAVLKCTWFTRGKGKEFMLTSQIPSLCSSK